MVLMDGEYRAIDISSYPTDNNATVTYDWVSDIDFGAGLSGEGNTLDFLATNSSSMPITANVTVSSTVTYNGTSCLVPSETFTVTVCAEEIQDGIDNDCDGDIDEGFDASGTVTDIDGNTYDYLTYGNQVWTVENAEMITYRDGTEIPQVTADTEWANLTTGAWCYQNNDLTKGKLYNWYAVAGIHDNDPNTPNKEFAPEGWHVPSDAEWTTLEEHLIANGHNYDGTTEGNKIAKAMASTTGWNSSTAEGAPGNDQSLNNDSGFNAFPSVGRDRSFSFGPSGNLLVFWSSSEENSDRAWMRNLFDADNALIRFNLEKQDGNDVRFVRD
jgi:uncharacterized protein (TIGR02145 family)